MKGIKSFINILGENHVCSMHFSENAPKPDNVLGRLRGVLSEKVVNEIDDLLSAYACELAIYSVSEGMKAAIEIMSGGYTVEI